MANANSTDWTLGGLDNPLKVQAALLNRFESETGSVIVDTNNPACVIMEGMASLTAGCVRKIEDTVRPAIYPARANTAVDLYKHLSDYDYVDIFASPSNTVIVAVLDKNYVINNSIPVPGTSYSKMVIPSTTRFTIGDHSFGIYYPIQIVSNTNTGRFTVMYDRSVTNPLNTLSTTSLEYEERSYNDSKLIYIMIPVYQFEVSTYTFSIVSGTGFKETIPYTNKFYALRCITQVLQNPGHDDNEDDVWKEEELNLCVSGQVYDPETPTMVFTPDLANNTVTLELPYVYLTNGLVRGNTRVIIYTTEGAINYTIPAETMEDTRIDMFSQLSSDEEATYVEPFRKMSGLTVFPNGTNIIGGSDGMSYDTLRSRVITDTLRSKTLQTPDDITAYFENQGYVATLLRDGVTDRVFVAHSNVVNENNEVISADEIGTIFDLRDGAIGDYNTIVKTSPGIYTILPSTIYKFDSDKGICEPLTTVARNNLLNMRSSEKVSTLNSANYTISPFHLQVNTSDKYPSTITYDMSNAKFRAQSLEATRTDPGVSCMLQFNVGTLKTIKGDPKDFYRYTVKMSRIGLNDVDAVVTSGDMVNTANFRCIIAFKNISGTYYFAEAKWVSRTDDMDIFEMDIPSDYRFKQVNGTHTVSLWIPNNASSKGEEGDFPLTCETRIIFLARGVLSALGNVSNSNRALVTDFTNTSNIENLNEYYAMSETKIILRFGQVVNELDQRINLTYGETKYKTYDTTKFLTLTQPQYTLDERGQLVVDIGYHITKDIRPDTEKTYYNKSTDAAGKVTYVSLTLDKTNFDFNTDEFKWEFKSNKTYYEKTTDGSVNINTEYPAGTMLCLTKTLPESVTLNDATAPDFYGCHYMYEDEDGVEHTGVLAPDTALVDEEDNPRVFSITDAPIIPTFTVKDAHLSSEGDSIALGSYQLLNSKNKKTGLSSENDVWTRTGNDPAIAAGSHNTFRVYDALSYVWKNQFNRKDTKQVIDAAKSTTPLKGVLAPTGTFILVNNDCSGYEEGVVEITPISHRDIVTPITKMYYCYDAKTSSNIVTACSWVCVAQGQDQAGMWTTIEHNAAPTNKLRKSYGYVYVGDMSAKSTNDTVYTQTFVSFLNTTDYKGYTVPSFEKFSVEYESPETTSPDDPIDTKNLYYIATDGSDDLQECDVTSNNAILTVGDITLAQGQHVVVCKPVPGGAWTNHVNKWPWDTKVWYIVDTDVLTLPGQSFQCQRYSVDTSFNALFDNSRIGKYCEYTSNQYELDGNGELQEADGGSRYIQYLISMVQLDARPMFTTANQLTETYPSSVNSILRTHFDNLGEAKNRMFTNTRLYWAPLHSLGLASFRRTSDETIKIPLDINIRFRIYVDAATAKDSLLIKNIKSSLVALVDKYMSNETFSCIEVANAAREELGDIIKHIDVLGINGDTTLQTLTSVDEGVRCHLGHTLELLDDGTTIDINRALSLDVVIV